MLNVPGQQGSCENNKLLVYCMYINYMYDNMYQHIRLLFWLKRCKPYLYDDL